MDLIEIKQKERLGREEIAARLRDFEEGGTRVRAHVPDEVDFKVEFEIDDEGTELEIELTW